MRIHGFFAHFVYLEPSAAFCSGMDVSAARRKPEAHNIPLAGGHVPFKVSVGVKGVFKYMDIFAVDYGVFGNGNVVVWQRH